MSSTFFSIVKKKSVSSSWKRNQTTLVQTPHDNDRSEFIKQNLLITQFVKQKAIQMARRGVLPHSPTCGMPLTPTFPFHTIATRPRTVADAFP